MPLPDSNPPILPLKVALYYLKAILPALLFYAVGIPAIYVLNKRFPSEPCAANLGMIFFCLFLLLSFIFLLISIYLTIRRERAGLPNIIMHIIGLIILLR